MRSTSVVMALASCLLAAGPSVAAVWAEEPTKVLGIGLGAPANSSGLPNCADELNRLESRACLHQPAGSDRMMVMHQPDLGFFYLNDITVIEGSIGKLMLLFNDEDSGLVFDLLIEKYGQPHSMNALRTIAVWSGKRVRLTVARRAIPDAPGMSAAVFEYLPVTKKKAIEGARRL